MFVVRMSVARPAAALVSVAMFAAPIPAWASKTVHCASKEYRYNYCRVDTDNRVRMERRTSNADCRRGSTWGYDRRGIWVDRGCAADFRVGRDDDNKNAATVAGVVVGAALLAALASQNKGNRAPDVPTWAIGSFSGYDSYEGADVRLTIMPGGHVSGRAGRHQFDGQFDGSRLQAGRHVFRVTRSGNGFLAVDERDASHRVAFRHSGGGY